MTHVSTEVLYIGGTGRSGSTLLSQVLGSLDGYISIGELNTSWEHSFLERRQIGTRQSSMSAETRDQLVNFYRPHNGRLFELLGEEFDWHG